MPDSTHKTTSPARPAKPPGQRDLTEHKLLDVAERLFAEQGFAATSVRQITEAAGANIASVNYHFGSKDGLYRAIYERLFTQLRDQRIAAIRAVVDEAEKKQDVEPIFRAFAEAFMKPLLDGEHGKLIPQLFMREMADQRLPIEMFMRLMVEPLRVVITDAMGRACPTLDVERAMICAHSLVGQLVHGVQMQQLFGRLGDPAVQFDLRRWMDHAVVVSVAGVAAYIDKPTR